jgi:hypothetical protein
LGEIDLFISFHSIYFLINAATVTTEDDDSEMEDLEDPTAAMIDPSLEEYKTGRYSPVYFSQVILSKGCSFKDTKK